MGKQLAGAPHAALDLVEPEEDAELVAGSAQVAQELQRRGADAALALDRLDDDAGGLRADRVAHRVHVVERHVIEAVDRRAEALKVFRIAGSREHRERAAVERAVEADDAEPLGLAGLASAFRIIFTMPSFASAPELQKKTLSANVASTSRAASRSACGTR